MPHGTQTFEYHLDKRFFDDMENADIHDADLNVLLTVTHKADLYRLDFAITGTITLICDRCLDALIQTVDTTYTIAVKYGDDYNDDNDDLLVIPQSDTTLNVAYMIHDTVALTIPIKHVHPMGKCNRQMSAMLKKHRARSAGDDDMAEDMPDDIDMPDAEDTVDPRWEALRNIGGADSE